MKSFTISGPEFARFVELAWRGRPGTGEWSVQWMAGWATVYVPNWPETGKREGREAFYRMVQPAQKVNA